MIARPALIFLLAVLLTGAGAEVACAQMRVAVPYSVRSYGMGLSGVADNYDPHNVYYNPAVVGAVHGLAFCGNLHPDLSHSGDDSRGWNSMVAGGVLRPNGESSAFGFGAALNYTGWNLEDYWFLGEATEQNIGVDAALQYVASDRTSIALGFGVKFWNYDPGPRPYTGYEPASGDGQLYDAGILISNKTTTESGRVYGVSAGASLINWGDDDDATNFFGDSFSEARLGLGIRVSQPDASGTIGQKSIRPSQWRLSVNVDLVVREDENDDSAHAGAEFSIREIGFLRAGYQALLENDVRHHATVGLGIGYDWGRVKFRIDYARVPASKKSDSGPPLDFFGLYLGYAFDPVL